MTHSLASAAALEVLRTGGNAVDAAVAAAAVLGVTEPHMTGIGGDMFAIVWLAKEQKLVAINASGRAGSRMVRAGLEAMGHRLIEQPPIAFGGAQAIIRLSRGYSAGSDSGHAPLPPAAEAAHCMAMPAVAPSRWTAREVRALPDQPGKRFECVDGELLVNPSPRLAHQWALGALFEALSAYCRAHGIGAVGVAPSEFELDQYTLVQPDLFIVPLVDGRRPVTAAELGRPLLFLEVLSPSTARADRVLKRRRYQRHGVPYWIVDVDARLVECWTPDAERPDVITGALTWQPAGTPTPCTLDLDALFAEALGER